MTYFLGSPDWLCARKVLGNLLLQLLLVKVSGILRGFSIKKITVSWIYILKYSLVVTGDKNLLE